MKSNLETWKLKNTDYVCLLRNVSLNYQIFKGVKRRLIFPKKSFKLQCLLYHKSLKHENELNVYA